MAQATEKKVLIDKDSSIPLYHQLVDHLEGQIARRKGTMALRRVVLLISTVLLTAVGTLSAGDGVSIIPAEHSLRTNDPGRFPLDLWGWETTPHYQRPQWASPNALKKRAVDESYKRGANLIELYPGGYPGRMGWNRETTRDFHKHVKAHRNMQIHWFPHHIRNGYSLQDSRDGLRSWCEEAYDLLSINAAETPGGLGTEHWYQVWPMLLHIYLNSYHPGAYFYTDLHRFPHTLPNEQDVTASCSTGVDDQTRGYFHLNHEIRKKHGLQFWGNQAESRNKSPSTVFGGIAGGDWILKQVNDMARQRARHRGVRRLSPSAIWWINEADNTTTDENRCYVYGCSQDPVKCAVSSSFFTLGGKGRANQSGRKIHPRYPYAQNDAFIQNNYFRLVQIHDRDESLLRLDRERLAHYDKSSHSVTVAKPFGAVIDSADRGLTLISAKFKHIEPAGFRAIQEGTYLLKGAQGEEIRQTRRITVDSDTPYFRYRVSTESPAKGIPLSSFFGLEGYDVAYFEGRTYSDEKTLKKMDYMTLADSSGRYPPMTVFLLDGSGVERISWKANNGIYIDYASKDASFELGWSFGEDLYGSDAMDELFTYLCKSDEIVMMTDGSCKIANPLCIPLTRVVRIKEADEHPYHIHEYGRWSFRGAQPSLEHPGEDYIKCYLRESGEAIISRYGYINDVARAGMGCQYTVSIIDCDQDDDSMIAAVDVRQVTSFIFAPAVEFKRPFSKVEVNGQPWRYFSGQTVYLPNEEGNYIIKAIAGPGEDIYLSRTYANITSVSYRRNMLTIRAELPPWMDSIPEDYYFTALIEHKGHSLTHLENASVIRDVSENKSIIRFKPGDIGLGFDGVMRSVPRESIEAIVEKHLRKRGAADVAQYLLAYSPEQVYWEDMESTISKYDVLVWNGFYWDMMPDYVSSDMLNGISEFVQRGGCLVLISDAIRCVPRLFDGGEDAATVYAPRFHRMKSIDVEGREDNRLFEGMSSAIADANTFSIFTDLEYGLFKRTWWPDGVPDGGRVLGEVRCMFEDNAEETENEYVQADTGAIWEWKLGSGKILGMGFGPPFKDGSAELTSGERIAARNYIQLMENVVSFVAGRKNDMCVGILR